MIQRQINAVHQIFQAITQSEIHITITQSPGDVATQFIFETLNVLTLIFGDVIRIPGDCKTQAIIGCIASLQETTHVRALEVGVMAMGSMVMMPIGMTPMVMLIMPVVVMPVVVMGVSFVFILTPWTIMLLVVMAIVVMMIVVMMIMLRF